MDAIATLNRMPHTMLNDKPYLKNEDARFVIEQLIEEYESNNDDKRFPSSRQIVGYIDGLLESKIDAPEDDPVVKVLQDIRFYITMSLRMV